MKPRSILAALGLGLGVASVAMLVAPQASAQSSSEQTSGKRVAVGELKGPKTQSAREWLVEGFNGESSVQVVDGPTIKQGASESEIAAYAKEVRADAVVLGTAALKPRVGWTAEVVVHNGEDGTVIESFEVKGGAWNKYRDAMRDVSTFMGAVERARLAPEPEPEPEPEEGEEEEAKDEEEQSPKESSARPSPLYARLGVRAYSRTFRYTETLRDLLGDSFPELPGYKVDVAPMIVGRIDLYPLAFMMDGIPAHIGLTGGYELGIATNVEFGEDRFQQSHSLWYAGLRGRIPVSTHEVGLFGTFGNHNFGLTGADALFPSISYQFVDLGADLRLIFDQLRLGANVRHRMLLGFGDLGSDAWFPNTSGRALSVGGEVGWQLSSLFELLVGVDVLQYGLTFDPDAGAPDNRVAGGATDRYTSVWGAISITLPGDAPGAVSASVSSGDGDEDDSGDDFDDF